MKSVRFVGLDVHKESIAVAVADDDGSTPQVIATLQNDEAAVIARLKKLGAGRRLRCCYEAGPTRLWSLPSASEGRHGVRGIRAVAGSEAER